MFITEQLAQLSSASGFYLLGVWITIVAENAALFELIREDHFLVGCEFSISVLFAKSLAFCRLTASGVLQLEE